MGFTDVDRLAINTIRVLAVSWLYLSLSTGICPAIGHSKLLSQEQLNVNISNTSTDIFSSRPMPHSNLTPVIPEPQCEFCSAWHNKNRLLMKDLGEWHQLPTFFSTRSWTSTQKTPAGSTAIDLFFRKSFSFLNTIELFAHQCPLCLILETPLLHCIGSRKASHRGLQLSCYSEKPAIACFGSHTFIIATEIWNQNLRFKS